MPSSAERMKAWTSDSAVALTTVMACYTTLQTASFSDFSQRRTLLRASEASHWLAQNGALSRRPASHCTGYRIPIRQRWHTSRQLWCTNDGRAPVQSTCQFCQPPSVDRRPGTRSADFIWWQRVRRRWSAHLEQRPTWCNPRFVSGIPNIHKTTKILILFAWLPRRLW